MARLRIPLLLSLLFIAFALATVLPGSGGAQTLAHLVISEVLYDPAGVEPDAEWIEIYNPGSVPLSLSGYKIGDEETHSLPDTGEYPKIRAQ